MIVSIKDSVKLFGISIMTCCAVTVCNMFLNYYLDLTAIAGLIDNPYAQMFYDAQIMTSKRRLLGDHYRCDAVFLYQALHRQPFKGNRDIKGSGLF